MDRRQATIKKLEADLAHLRRMHDAARKEGNGRYAGSLNTQILRVNRELIRWRKP